DLAPPSWQNSMATNCPQLLNPRACRSALCCRTAVSKPVREMSCKICEKMLHTRFKAESSSDSLVFSNSTYQRLSAFFFPAALNTAELIWTRMINTVISDEVWLARPPANVSIHKEFDLSLIEVNLDAGRFAEALKELLRNSLKAIGSRGGQILIRTMTGTLGADLGPASVVVEIEDSGPGFPQDFP